MKLFPTLALGVIAVASIAIAAPAHAQAPAQYELTMDNMKKLATAMQALKNKDSEVEMNDDDSLDQTVAKIKGNAAAMAALQKAGMSPRDYVLTLTSYLQAGMVVAAQKVDATYKTPPDVSAKNVAFIKAHRAELEQMSKQMGLSQ